MKAAVMHEFNKIVLEEVPVPSPKKGELLVRVRSTRVCGTDVGMYQGRQPGAFLPRILGHECSGEVARVGDEVTGFKPGDRIGMYPFIDCGQCYFCREGRHQMCVNFGMIGREVNGSFAEYTIINANGAVKIADSMSFDVACFMDAVASGYHSAIMTKLLRPGASVVVLGMGPVGLIHTQFAKLAGANPVIGIDILQWKLDLARQLGADVVVNAKNENPVEAIMRLTPHGGADVVIESVGFPETIRQTYQMVMPGGEVMQFGIGPTSVDNINTFLVYFKEITSYGSRGFTHNEFNLAQKFLADQTIRVEPLITHRLPLEKTVYGLELPANKSEKALGIIINS